MVDGIIRWSLHNRVAVIALALLLTAVGTHMARRMPVDVFPDLTAPTVTVITEAHGMAPMEVESQVTFPIEASVNGASGVRRVRSSTAVGISVVWVEFEWGTDIYSARQIVSEKVSLVSGELPPGVGRPVLAPISSIMGEILFLGLTSERHSPIELRTVADTTLRRRLLSIPGVSQVTPIGGGEKQYQVFLSPAKMRTYGLTLAQVRQALSAADENVSAGFLVTGGSEYLVTGVGRIRTPQDIAETVVSAVDGVPVRISDLASVRIDAAPKRGEGSVNTKPAVILGVQKQPGANTLSLTHTLDTVLDEIQAGLPAGMTINRRLFRQADFIDTAVENVLHALRDGGILVQLVMKNYPNLLDFEDACRYLWPSHNCTAGRRSRWYAAASHRCALPYPPKSTRPWNGGNVRPPSRQGWHGVGKSSCCWSLGTPNATWLRPWVCNGPSSVSGPSGFSPSAWMASLTPLAAEPRAVFPPEVAIHVVRLACERPDTLGRSLSQWDCAELAHQLIADGIVEDISAATVRRILAYHHLKPWRHHLWLYPKRPRDAAFYATISELIDLYTRPLPEDEIVLSVDEKTSLQPRPRLAPTRPAQPGNIPSRYEHEYKRSGALNLFAAFDTRSGTVFGHCYPRKRQQEFITFLEQVDGEIGHHIKTIHLVCDNVSTHHGKEVCKWLVKHPRFVFHFTPVHCSWMNQVEQWFSIFQRKRLRIADFASIEHLQAKIEQFIREWNQHAHPFNWSTKSVAKVMAEVPAMAA